MKKLLFLFFLLAIIDNINSQSYFPLLKEGNRWNVLRDYYNPTHYTEIINADLDTLVDGILCKKVVSTRDTSTFAIFINRYLLFEDTIANKIYSLDNQNNIRLYFDFTAQLGDTLALYSPYYNSLDTFVVSQISNVEINNTSRKKITLDYYSSNFHMQNVDSWIEGVGSIKGLIYGNISPQFVGQQFSLLCMSNSNEILYQNPNATYCYYTNVKIKEYDMTSISIYPNPVINNLQFTNLPENATNLKVIDFYGRCVYKSVITNGDMKVSLANLTPGLYKLIIFNEEEILSTKSFIKI